MSYIAFDLDAINVARDVGAAAGLPEERITHGLLRMWAWCFREKRDTVQAIQVHGFFGAAAAPALVAFGFLAVSGDDFRVRGADRYLRVAEGRRKGGLAASKNLIPGGPKRKIQPRGDAEHTAESQPRVSRESAEQDPRLDLGLSPNTEHRTPNSKRSASDEPTQTRDSDLLVSDFKAVMGSDYRWQGAKDGVALASLLKTAGIDEVRTRWKRGLAADANAWASCRTVAQLASKWNDLANAKPPPPTKPYLRDLG